MAQPVTRDQTTVLGWRNRAGETALLAGSANYEDGLALGPVARQYDLAGKRMDDSLPGQASSTGPMALGDFAGDGNLALFVGEWSVPGRYSEPAAAMRVRDVGDIRGMYAA